MFSFCVLRMMALIFFWGGGDDDMVGEGLIHGI